VEAPHHAGRIEVLPDVSCPLDRQLWLSIGAAIANLRVAAAHFGFDTTVLFNADTTLVSFHESFARSSPAIKKRHTNRRRFGDDSGRAGSHHGRR
jgi:hypothetical protein